MLWPEKYAITVSEGCGYFEGMSMINEFRNSMFHGIGQYIAFVNTQLIWSTCYATPWFVVHYVLHRKIFVLTSFEILLPNFIKHT